MKLLAYLGRYAHQPASVMLGMSQRDLYALATATAELIQEERDSLEAQ